MKEKFPLLSYAYVAAICAGCASSGHHPLTAVLPATKLICVNALDPQLVPFVVPTLQSRAYTTIGTNNPSAMVCRGDCGGAFGMHVNVSLWYEDRLIAEGRATNPGFGCWLNRGSVVQDLSANATAAMLHELDKLPLK